MSILTHTLRTAPVWLAAAAVALLASSAQAEPPELKGGSVTPIEVLNPLQRPMQGHTIVDPDPSTPEHRILLALNGQRAKGTFSQFLSHMHDVTKSESQQREALKAYQYKSSRGKIADQCVHDGALVTTARKDVNARVPGSGALGVKVFVWCGAGRMPVPFTLYPVNDTWKIKVWGLN